MNGTGHNGKTENLVAAVGSANLSSTLDAIGSAFQLQLEGEVRDLAGVLNPDAAYHVKTNEEAKGVISESDWGYYAKQLRGAPNQFLKVWVRWNAQKRVYDYYLSADAGSLFSHATPYVGTIMM